MLFIFDALEPMDDDALTAVADDLVIHLTPLAADIQTVRRLIRAGSSTD